MHILVVITNKYRHSTWSVNAYCNGDDLYQPSNSWSWNRSASYPKETISQYECLKTKCPRHIPQTPLFKRLVKKIFPTSNAQVIYVQETCPPPVAMGYVHTIHERCMAPCGGYVPWIFLMCMIVVDMATRVYSTSAVKSTWPRDIKLTDKSRRCYPWTSTPGGDFPDINNVYWRDRILWCNVLCSDIKNWPECESD